MLPETLEEAEELAASIERAVQYETGRGVDDLTRGGQLSRHPVEGTLHHLLHQAIGPTCRHEHSRRRPTNQQHRGLLSVGVAPLGDCPNFRGHRAGTDAQRWSAVVDENGTVPFDAGPPSRGTY